jgi:hypothetical protein
LPHGGAPSQVSGGNTLFFGTNMEPFVTYDVIVPVSSTILLVPKKVQQE